MLPANVKRTISFLLITIITVVFLTFAVANREVVSISLFPLPYSADMPKFLLALLCFSCGAITGWLMLSLKISRTKRLFKKEHTRVMALQNEVEALRTERTPLPTLPAK